MIDTRAITYTHKNIYIYTHIQTYIHSFIHSFIHTYIHTHTHTHARTHTHAHLEERAIDAALLVLGEAQRAQLDFDLIGEKDLVVVCGEVK
jgi:hypothetical protein